MFKATLFTLLLTLTSLAKINLNLHNTVTFLGPINTHMVSEFCGNLETLSKNRGMRTGYVLILSHGGSLPDTYTAINCLKKYKNVHAVLGVGMSGAAALFESASKRIITSKSVLMFHKIKVPLNGYYTQEQLDTELQSLKIDNVEFNRVCCTKLNISYLEYEQRVVTDWYLKGSEQIMAFGAADKIEKIIIESDLVKEVSNYIKNGGEL